FVNPFALFESKIYDTNIKKNFELTEKKYLRVGKISFASSFANT
ncbi:27251_t:CDS:1, partial [Dentiscutata erythropus]